ncbi:MAG: lmo0937 family membrane protein [Candidatus Ozemobacteraceae bacterium]
MLDTIAVLLVLGWLMGMVTSYTINGFIHVLLVVAVIVVLIRIINGRKPLGPL